MRTIRVGLIGAGGIAQTHCRAISDVAGTELVCVADVFKDKAEQTAARWKIPHV